MIYKESQLMKKFDLQRKSNDEESWFTKKINWPRKRIDEEIWLMKKVDWLMEKIDWWRNLIYKESQLKLIKKVDLQRKMIDEESWLIGGESWLIGGESWLTTNNKHLMLRSHKAEMLVLVLFELALRMLSTLSSILSFSLSRLKGSSCSRWICGGQRKVPLDM